MAKRAETDPSRARLRGHTYSPLKDGSRVPGVLESLALMQRMARPLDFTRRRTGRSRQSYTGWANEIRTRIPCYAVVLLVCRTPAVLRVSGLTTQVVFLS